MSHRYQNFFKITPPTVWEQVNPTDGSVNAWKSAWEQGSDVYKDTEWYEAWGDTPSGALSLLVPTSASSCHIWAKDRSQLALTHRFATGPHLTHLSLWKLIAFTCGPRLRRIEFFGFSIRTIQKAVHPSCSIHWHEVNLKMPKQTDLGLPAHSNHPTPYLHFIHFISTSSVVMSIALCWPTKLRKRPPAMNLACTRKTGAASDAADSSRLGRKGIARTNDVFVHQLKREHGRTSHFFKGVDPRNILRNMCKGDMPNAYTHTHTEATKYSIL